MCEWSPEQTWYNVDINVKYLFIYSLWVIPVIITAAHTRCNTRCWPPVGAEFTGVWSRKFKLFTSDKGLRQQWSSCCCCLFCVRLHFQVKMHLIILLFLKRSFVAWNEHISFFPSFPCLPSCADSISLSFLIVKTSYDQIVYCWYSEIATLHVEQTL